MGLLSEFKEFIKRGNVVDLAVGVVIGSAFGKIVNSIVNDILMPPIGMLLNGVSFTDIKLVLKKGHVDESGLLVPPVTVNFGNFIQVLIEFIIVAFAIFLLVKFINKMRKHDDDTKPEPVASKEVILLTEIRDLLKK